MERFQAVARAPAAERDRRKTAQLETGNVRKAAFKHALYS
jgi:hypothetical protein